MDGGGEHRSSSIQKDGGTSNQLPSPATLQGLPSWVVPMPDDTWVEWFACGFASQEHHAVHVHFGADGGDVVGPEDGAEFGEVGLVEVRIAGGGGDVDAADVDGEARGLRGDDDVGAVDGELVVDAVADGGGEGEHGGDGGGAEQDGEAGEEFAAALAAEGLEEEAEEHLVATSAAGGSDGGGFGVSQGFAPRECGFLAALGMTTKARSGFLAALGMTTKGRNGFLAALGMTTKVSGSGGGGWRCLVALEWAQILLK